MSATRCPKPPPGLTVEQQVDHYVTWIIEQVERLMADQNRTALTEAMDFGGEDFDAELFDEVWVPMIEQQRRELDDLRARLTTELTGELTGRG